MAENKPEFDRVCSRCYSGSENDAPENVIFRVQLLLSPSVHSRRSLLLSLFFHIELFTEDAELFLFFETS